MKCREIEKLKNLAQKIDWGSVLGVKFHRGQNSSGAPPGGLVGMGRPAPRVNIDRSAKI